MDYQVDFTKAYRDLYEGIAAKGGVMGKGKDDEEKKPAAKPDAKAKGGDKKDGEGDESAVKQAVYDIRYRAKREGVPVAQAMTDYLKHSASLGPKARAELKKKLLGEEILNEISADLALTASQKADEVRRKAAIAGDRETAAKKAQQASRIYKGVASRRAKERMAKEEVEHVDEAMRPGPRREKMRAKMHDPYVRGGSKTRGQAHNIAVRNDGPGTPGYEKKSTGGKGARYAGYGDQGAGNKARRRMGQEPLRGNTRKEDYTLGELKAILEDDSLAHLHADVFDLVESFLIGEEVIEEASSKKSQKGETLYKVRVVNNDDRAEVRYASRAKISQLRSNDNIKSVEITGHGEAYNEKPKKGGEKKLDPVGKEDGDVDNDGDQDSSDKYLMKRRKAIGKAMAKEESEVDECWKTHKKVGMKMKGGKLVNDCRPKNEEVEVVDENRAAARSAGGYKDDSKKQPDPSKKGFTGIGNMSIDQIRKMSARIEKEKSAKK